MTMPPPEWLETLAPLLPVLLGATFGWTVGFASGLRWLVRYQNTRSRYPCGREDGRGVR